jgi:hypothetical protein
MGVFESIRLLSLRVEIGLEMELQGRIVIEFKELAIFIRDE